jgi:hypothetical protein
MQVSPVNNVTPSWELLHPIYHWIEKTHW